MAYTLLQYRNRGLAREELRKLYGHERVIGKRIADFLDARIASEDNGILRITRKGVGIVRIYLLLDRLLGMGAFVDVADQSAGVKRRPPTYSGNRAEAAKDTGVDWITGK
jgi:hypothetical protein